MIFLMLTSIWGCVKTELIEDVSKVELTATMEYEAETRTSLSGLENGMYYPLWSAGDEIAVFADGDSEPSKFTLNSGEGTTVASFTGSRQGDEYVAIYPYDMADNMSDGIISLTLPQTQTYVPDSFGQGSFPMIATGGSDGSLKFMNLCSVLKISLTGTAAIRNVKLTANNDNTFMSGPASVKTDYAASSESQLSMSAGGSRSVVLETKGLEISEDSPADVFIVVPSQTYAGGFTIEIDTYTDTLKTTVTSDITFERSQIRAIKELVLDSEIPDLIPEAIPDNEIWYVTNDGKEISLAGVVASYPDAKFNTEVISNKYHDGLGVITFADPVTTIEEGAFMMKDNLVRIYLPSSLNRICAGSFRSCLNLEEVYINCSDVTVYHPTGWNPFIENPFSHCSMLSRIVADQASEDEKCLIIDGCLFSFASYGMTEYSIPDGVKEIQTNAFADSELEEVIFPEGLEYIGADAFANSKRLRILIFPSTLKQMEAYAFRECISLEGFYGNENFHTSDNKCLLFEFDGEKWISFFAGKGIREYTLQEGIVGIENYTFISASSLEKLNFPNSLIKIGPHAFEGASNISEITGKYVLGDKRSMVVDGMLVMVAGSGLSKYATPEEATILGQSVLGFNDDVIEYEISDKVTEVDSYGYMFKQCPNLETITISARMKYLGYDPFCDSIWETPNLKTVYCRAPIPPIVYHNSPEYGFEDLTIYVPEESLKLYKASDGWKPYEKYLQPYDYGDLTEFYPDCYISSDYSTDGAAEILQTATKGEGIDIVLLGDGYSDRQIADGTYKADMEFAYRSLFTEEPYKSHQDMFNVSYVNVVSMTEGYEHGGSTLGCQFGGGTYVYGNDALCFEYAQNAVAEEDMDEALVVVVMNSDAYAGTCFMYHPIGTTKDYGSGAAVAYFPKGTDEDMFAQLLHHEACGHGFAKLADEYAYEDMGEIPSSVADDHRRQQNDWGWWKNVDFTGDVTKVRWANFIEDERYANEGLGAYEGGLTYWSGVWRPTQTSIMVDNTGVFNAPSREAIYYRIHKLAYGDDWEYDYEKFVEYDAVNRAAAAAGGPQKRRANYVEKQYEPLHPPVVVGKTWREAGSN